MTKLRRWPSPALAVSMLALFVALGAGSFAVGAIPGKDGTITACYSSKTGVVRAINADKKKKCKKGEKKITWNQKGVQGTQGAPGAPGAPGAKGDPGPSTPQTIGDGSIGTAQLADNAVTSPKVADAAIGAADLGANSVGASEVGTDAVGGLEIADNSIDSGEVIDHGLNAVDVTNFNGTFLNADLPNVPDGECISHDLSPAIGIEVSDAVVITPSFIEAGIVIQPMAANGAARMRVCNFTAADINPTSRDYHVATFDTDAGD
jgi:hypothetical protein